MHLHLAREQLVHDLPYPAGVPSDVLRLGGAIAADLDLHSHPTDGIGDATARRKLHEVRSPETDRAVGH